MSSAVSGPSRVSRLWSRLRLPLLVSTLALPADVLVSYVRARIPESVAGEFHQFGPAGAAILRGEWGNVYVAANNQAGPFELLPYGIADIIGVHGTVEWTSFYVVLLFLACLVLTAVMLQQVHPARGRWVTYGTLGATYLAILGSILPNALFLGHPAEVLVPLLWIAAGVFAMKDRYVACGLFIAASAGFEVWGVLGAPVLSLASSPRLLRAAIAGAAGLAILYVPFVATGAFAMFGFHWTVGARTLYGFVWPDLVSFPWSLRLVQAVAALGAGTATALLFRRNRSGPVSVPLAVVSVRLLLDPLLLSYYWLAPAVIAVVTLALAIFWRAWVVIPIAIATLVVTWLAPSFPLLASVLLVCICVGLVLMRPYLASPLGEDRNLGWSRVRP